MKSEILRLLNSSGLLASSFQALQHRERKDRELVIASFEALPSGQGPLHIGAYWGLTSTAEFMLASGIDSSPKDNQAWTPLHWACSNGHLSVIKSLVMHGTDLNSGDAQGWTPLFWASFKGNVQIVNFLLDQQVDHLIADVHGWTALHWAVSRGEKDVVEALIVHHSRLLDSGEIVELPIKTLSVAEARRLQTPKSAAILLAAKGKDIGIFDTLLQHLQAANQEPTRVMLNTFWKRKRFDPPMSNVWRVFSKAESMSGAESYIDGPMRRSDWVPKSENWKSKMLHVAIRDEKILILRLLIELGADVNFQEKMTGRTPLHTASFRKDRKFVQMLLDNKADPSLTDKNGQTSLHQAILNGFEETITCFIENGCDVNAKTGRGYSPLMLACGFRFKNGDDLNLSTRLVQKLIAKGADVSYANETGRTALHCAVEHCGLETMKVLVGAGAEIREVESSGRHLIHHFAGNDAEYSESREISELKEIIHFLLEISAPGAENKEYEGNTPLSISLKHGNWDLFKVLLAIGARFRSSDSFEAPLKNAIQGLQQKAVQFLLHQGVRLEPGLYNDSVITSMVESVNFNDTSFPLRRASTLDSFILILRDLLASGVDINAVRERGTSALLAAAKRTDSADVMQILIESGADLCHADDDGYDAFLFAALHEKLQTLRCLLSYSQKFPHTDHWLQPHISATLNDVDPMSLVVKVMKTSGLIELRNGYGLTPLQLASRTGNTDMVKKLLEHGADIEAVNKYGWTSLHTAVCNGNEAVVDMLLQAKAEVCAATKEWHDGWRRPGLISQGEAWRGHALHLAAMFGRREIAKKLLACNPDVNADTGCRRNESWSPSHGTGALHIALDTGPFYERDGTPLDRDRLCIAQMLVDQGADVQTAADRLNLDNVLRFNGFEDLWEKLRIGISEKGMNVRSYKLGG